MDRTPPIEFRLKHGPLNRTHEWCELDFRGADEVEVEEDLEEVANN